MRTRSGFDDDFPRVYAASAGDMFHPESVDKAGPVNEARSKFDNILKLADDWRARVIMVDCPNYCGSALLPLHSAVVPITPIRPGNKAIKACR